MICSACGKKNPPEARFCLACGTEFAAPTAPAREERKVLTVVFADLVGFTSRAEKLDPEDVRALLAPYHARVRSELEAYGGTVEKFIGDAVMALFGAPVTREDDPERAVRAALAIRDWIAEEGKLEVRIAVNTGEALVNLAARPEAGEGMAAGDVVNTTARLQSAAPVNGILVGETTWRATRHAIEYEEREPVEAKGKSEPIAVWEAVQARARLGVDITSASRTPLVGREQELGVLGDALERARREPSVQLVTLVGVPGIGKSRLVYELMREVESAPGLVTWRQGRCLPYGDGVAFWALSEMVKAQIGALQADSADVVAAKLSESVDALVDTAEASWVKRHLGVLAGTIGDVTADRDEAFAAWRRFLEALAEQRPTVLVFEDLHWADDGLLDFVDHVVDWAGDVPLLVLGTARPELFTRRSGWGGGKRNAVTLSLSPLADDDTARMIGAVLGRSVLPTETQSALLERAAGNPLYAEQYARLFAERGDVADLPENVQGIIAARLDSLAPAEKALLQGAAVLGKVFWLGAVGATEQQLLPLRQKEFVQRARRSSVEGEAEYAFRHVLVRDVAYAQIPRAARAEKHLWAADWIAGLGREAEHAEMLAYHYRTSLELNRAFGKEDDVLLRKTHAALGAAGDRARSLQAFAAAVGYYADALALAHTLDLAYAHAEAVFRALAPDRQEILERARDELLASSDAERAAEIETMLGDVVWFKGDHVTARRHVDRALELVAARSPSAAKARVVGQAARHAMLLGDTPTAVELGNQALAMADTFGLDDLRADILVTIGTALLENRNRAGAETIMKAIELAERCDALRTAARAYHNLGATMWQFDFDEAVRYLMKARELAHRLGDREMAHLSDGIWIGYLYSLGRWEEALTSADEYIAECEAGGPRYGEDTAREARALIRHARGDDRGAADDLERALSFARATETPQAWTPVVLSAATIWHELGRDDEATQATHELFAHSEIALPNLNTAAFAFLARELGLADDMRRLLDAAETVAPLESAARAILEGDDAAAADMLEDIGIVVDSAQARLRAARSLAAAGRSAEAEEQLRPALAFFRSVGARRYVRDAEALLPAAS
jgi:class 3 adenylate cyclase/tetratricopeptide (TPR) repeat protein